MAMQPRIAGGPRLAPIPVTQKPVSPLADALQVAAQAAARIDQSDRQTQLQVDAINHEIAMKKQRDEDDALSMQQAAKWAEAQGRIEKRIADARLEHGPGGQGHAERVREILREEVDAFDQGFLGNDRVRNRYFDNVASVAAKYETRETLYASDQFAKAQGENAETFLKTTVNALMLNPDPQRVEEAITLWDSLSESMALNDDGRAAVSKQGRGRIFSGFIDGLLEKGQYEQADALIKSGKLNGVLDDVQPYLRKIDVERRAAIVAQEQAAADAREEAREAIKAVEEKVRLGINPSPEELAAVRGQAVGAGLPEADIISLDGLGIQMGINRQYNEAVDPTGAKAAAAVTRLGGKIASGKASEAEQVAYKQLQGIAEARGKSAGAALREMASQGPQGRLQALQQLQTLPASQRFVAGQEAGEGLGFLAQLPAHTQRYAVDGTEVRKARKDEFGKEEVVRAAFRNQVGGVAATLGGDFDDIMNVAWDIYAGTMNSKGRTGWDQAHFDSAVRIAFGATKRQNGVMQGGIGNVRGKAVILPEWKTAAEFDQSLSRLTFKGAVYADGSPAQKGDVLRNYRPEYYRDDANGQPIYRFIDAKGKPLRHKDGAVFDIVVQR